MYVLVLAALLAWDDFKPTIISPHRSIEACAIAADKKAKEYEDEAKTEAWTSVGAKFVCLQLVATL